ncbi:MAG: NAD(P)-dependent oxidoreductase [Planctomycetes bacterium]|nr:NAD(P)-dependent oxidoreductase [Planctomycetota bacterium]
MRILLIGGSGYLGSLLLPIFRQEHWVRVLDVVDPKEACDEFVRGSVLDLPGLQRAMPGVGGVIYLPMGKGPGGEVESIVPSYDVNVKGLHLAFEAARGAGITHAVYPSTLSIYRDYTGCYLTSEADCPGNAPHIYGFTKWLGEQVCRFFGEHRGMTITALRLCGPMSLERWEEAVRKDGYTLNIAAPDVADAMVRALRRPGPGYEALFITGDYEERQMSLRRARELLGWQPKARLGTSPDDRVVSRERTG